MLASTSPWRRELLGRLGVPFDVEAPGVDEDAWKRLDLSAEAMVSGLSAAKARAVAARNPGAIVIGSDQCAVLGDDRLGKPGSRAAAVDQLRRLSGRTHTLVTGIHVVFGDTGVEHDEVVSTRLTMRTLGEEDLQRYVDLDDPVSCAGSYRIEAAGISLFSKIEGGDHTAIMGLPLLSLTRILETEDREILRWPR